MRPDKPLLALSMGVILWWISPPAWADCSLDRLSVGEGEQRLQSGAKALVLFTSNDPLLGRLVEDMLALELADQRISVVSREKIEMAVAEILAADSQAAAVDSIVVGRRLEAELVLTGTVITEIGEDQVIGVPVISLQLIRVSTEATIARAIVTCDKGQRSLSDLAVTFAGVLRQIGSER